ncbi:hypothetical protein ACRE_086880 [Hapsidospora chrysogenum ATCC 11550]|uniref:Uncharacterized protein n=1 Tax=Hapsidospora chrysogenum (strain ATCC 11550 / CBS 779.69 / DSM 880 / IAM 14645 / JCM 23072 / IMI 49137) TaxID=857340 RepID=A0A086SU35_HAPC1|nr:hypothetical protein ACRE_086880 [Hapsidospora chrysogenum ATCC 11550]
MKFTQSFLTSGLLAGALAAPSRVIPADVQVAHFQFNGESESYKLNVTADGKVYQTKKDIPVKNINIDDYNANEQCVFKTTGGKKLDPQFETNSNDGSQMLVLEEAKPIVSVACEGTCIGIYGLCYSENNQPLGLCCNGFCAAKHCRPWNTNGP